MTVTHTHPRIIVVFDLCSSSQMMQDLLLGETFHHYEALLACIKRWLIERTQSQPTTNGSFEMYKFMGDGWILLFPAETSGEALLEFMRALCEMVNAELKRHIIPHLGCVPPILGATLGVEKGNLIKMTMHQREEYIGDALNIACRLQNAVKENDPTPGYKALVSSRLYNKLLGHMSAPYKVETVTCKLRNILEGNPFACRRIDFAVAADGHSLSWPDVENAGASCATSNWDKEP